MLDCFQSGFLFIFNERKRKIWREREGRLKETVASYLAVRHFCNSVVLLLPTIKYLLVFICLAVLLSLYPSETSSAQIPCVYFILLFYYAFAYFFFPLKHLESFTFISFIRLYFLWHENYRQCVKSTCQKKMLEMGRKSNGTAIKAIIVILNKRCLQISTRLNLLKDVTDLNFDSKILFTSFVNFNLLINI